MVQTGWKMTSKNILTPSLRLPPPRKELVEELVKSNSDLTTTNAEFPASVNILIKANKQFSCWFFNLRNNLTWEYSPAPWPKNLCPHCKIEVMHAPHICFEVYRGWKSSLCQWGTSKIVDIKVDELSHSPLSAFISSNRYGTTPLIKSLTRSKP